ncbi:MAG: hypothetical protein ABDK94_00440 [Atribacterota bacterium]
MDIDDLRFNLETENLQCTHGDPFPERITKKDVLHGKLFFEYLPKDFQVQWSGYTLPVSLLLEAISRRGRAQASFESFLAVRPAYAFEVWMQQDPERPWWYLPTDEVIRGLYIFDPSGKEITKNLTLEKRDDHVVRISGVAPGFPSAALPLRLVWKRGERIFEFQPRLGSLYKEMVIVPSLGGEWEIFLTFSANSAEQVNDPARFTPPRFTLTLSPNAHPKADFIVCDDEMHSFQKTGFCGIPSSDPDGVIVKYQ